MNQFRNFTVGPRIHLGANQETVTTANHSNNIHPFICKKCSFGSSCQMEFDRHNSSLKHLLATQIVHKPIHGTGMSTMTMSRHPTFSRNQSNSLPDLTITQSVAKSSEDESTLSGPVTGPVTGPIDHTILFELLKQNREFRELIVQQNGQIVDQNHKMLELVSKFGSTNNI
jgi:hypothetical protein